MSFVFLLIVVISFISFSNTQDCGIWFENTQHSSFFRNVKDYGAKGDGNTDDTSAIVTALTQGRQNKASTKQPLLLYFPPGNYLVSNTLEMYPYTHITGNWKCLPTITLKDNAPGYNGQKDVFTASFGTGEHTSNFYHVIQNLKINLGAGNPGAVGIHWAVAQGTALRNLNVNVNSGKFGVFAENGGGGWMSDLTFTGGDTGMLVGGQQWSMRSITIENSRSVGLDLIWNWSFTLFDIKISNTPTAIKFQGSAVTALNLLDSTITNCKTGIETDYPTTVKALLFDDVTFDKVATITNSYPGNPNGVINVKSWRQGTAYNKGSKVAGETGDLPVVRNVKFPVKPRPQLENPINVMSKGAKGDGVTDDTQAIQNAIDESSTGEVFFPFGNYLISNTISLKANTKLRGEAYAVLLAKEGASAFSDKNNPKALLATAQGGSNIVSGLILSPQGDVPGCVLLEWNSGENSALYDVHFRIEHTTYMTFHLTRSAGGIFENTWLWTADHSIDHGGLLNVTNPRGWLIESESPTYLYGTASEHHYYYQYNITNAANVYLLFTQTEIPYWVDPVVAYSMSISNSKNVFSYGSGYYTWFHGGNVTLGPTQISNCQDTYLYGSTVHNFQYQLRGDHDIVADYTNTFCSFFSADTPY